MKMKLYNFLVNRHPGISSRYHKIHDGSSGMKKVASWVYLFGLNICYYVFFCRFLDKQQKTLIYEEKHLPTKISESEAAVLEHPDIDETVSRLLAYDVISFDIFDTLVFRPFSEPADLFYFIGEKLGFMDFKRIRMEMEARVREECRKQHGHTEVTLYEIWEKIQKETGISAKEGSDIELSLEKEFLFANPFMLAVFKRLVAEHKKIIAVSDMYLPKEFLQKVLEEQGFHGIEELFISCEYGKNKASGSLFGQVRDSLAEHTKSIHVGDHPLSDVELARKHGFDALYYPNVNKNTLLYRAYDMSPVIGGAYRGIINSALYNGTGVYGMEYEFGFIYGGLFALGYCNFIHEYCRKNEIDKILFLSRDGDILKQVYDRVFQEEVTEYVYWSRAASVKLMADDNKYDYYRRFLFHKVNQKKTLEEVLAAMDLQNLVPLLKKGMYKADYLTERNVEKIKLLIEEHWDVVRNVYQEQKDAGRNYYASVLNGCQKVCAVDIGWAGSGAVSLRHLAEKVWKLNCEVIGLIAGTNTVHNAEPDAGEMFLQTGKLVSYLFSQSENRDLMKKHDLNSDYNIFWELLLSSPTRQFQGFVHEGGSGEIRLCFGKEDANQEGIREIQKGILDFAETYLRHFKDKPFMLHISGRDAYAPMLVAAAFREAYLKAINEKFSLSVGVGD